MTKNAKKRSCFYFLGAAFIFSFVFAIGVLIGLRIETQNNIGVTEQVSSATDIAQTYFNFTDIICELNNYCFVNFELKDTQVQFPFARWQSTEHDIIEIYRIKGYDKCLDNSNIDITFNNMLLSSFKASSCPLPKGAIALNNINYLLVQDKDEVFSIFSPEIRLSNIAISRSRNNSVLISKVSGEIYLCSNNFTGSLTVEEECYFQVNLSPPSAVISLYKLDDFKEITFSSMKPTVAPTETAILTNNPTLVPTISPTQNPTLSEFDEQYKGSKPNIVVVMLDDVGYGDVGFGKVPGYAIPRPKIQEATPFITNLAEKESIILSRHYGHWHCSPSRRSFLTGRLSIHTGERLSRQADHDLDLRFKWISEKLKQANYSNYLVGKGHFGYESVYHLPTLRGFDDFTGILNGQAKYNDFTFWEGNFGNETETELYSTHYFGLKAQEYINKHSGTPEDPFFLFLSLQSPHTPIEPPDVTYSRYKKYTQKKLHPYEFMMYTADYEIEQIVSQLKDKGVWNNTLLLFVADNGATSQNLWTKDPFKNWKTRGSNYPFRGEKKSSFEGGFRVPAFLSGGIVPEESRGKQSGLISHISDWYSTFCYLAGIGKELNPQELEQETFYENLDHLLNDQNQIDPRSPSLNNQNLWGDHFPAPDSLNLASHLLKKTIDTSDHHPPKRKNELLMLSTEAMIYKDFKFIAAQPCSFFVGTTTCKEDDLMFAWIDEKAQDFNEVKKQELAKGCLKLNHPLKNVFYEPCVFDLSTDIREMFPLQNTTLLNELFQLFNQSLLSQYTDYLIGKENGLTPEHVTNSSQLSEEVLRQKQMQLFGTLQSPIKDIDSCFVQNRKLECPSLL